MRKCGNSRTKNGKYDRKQFKKQYRKVSNYNNLTFCLKFIPNVYDFPAF